MERRQWVPDIRGIADQLITDYCDALQEHRRDLSTAICQGDLDAIATMESWWATADAHDEVFTDDDWIALVQELARRAVLVSATRRHWHEAQQG